MATLSKPQFQHNTTEIICALGLYIRFSSFQCTITILPSYTQTHLSVSGRILTLEPPPSPPATSRTLSRRHLLPTQPLRLVERQRGAPAPTAFRPLRVRPVCPPLPAPPVRARLPSGSVRGRAPTAAVTGPCAPPVRPPARVETKGPTRSGRPHDGPLLPEPARPWPLAAPPGPAAGASLSTPPSRLSPGAVHAGT